MRLTVRLNAQKLSQKPNERLDRGHKEQKQKKAQEKDKRKKQNRASLLLARFFVDKKGRHQNTQMDANIISACASWKSPEFVKNRKKRSMMRKNGLKRPTKHAKIEQSPPKRLLFSNNRLICGARQ